MQMPEDVSIHTNVPYEELQLWLERAAVGLHTMRDEHFGIGVVEFQAAGYVGSTGVMSSTGFGLRLAVEGAVQELK